MQIVEVISTAFDSVKRRIVKVRRRGKDDIQTAKEYSPFGVDSNAPAGMRAIFAETGVKGKTALIGYLNLDKLAEVGETRLYSIKSDKTLSTFIWLKDDGTMQIGGDDDNMVRFSELKTGFDQLRGDFNTFITAFNTHVHATAPAGPVSPPTGVGLPASQSSASIDDSKIDEIKTI